MSDVWDDGRVANAIWELRQEVATLEDEVERLKDENAELKEENERLRLTKEEMEAIRTASHQRSRRKIVFDMLKRLGGGE